MTALHLASAIVALTAHAPSHVTAGMAFTATVEPTSLTTVDQHDLGGGVISTVATYQEGKRIETTETLAMVGDTIALDASLQLVARRYRHDRWPTELVAQR